MSVFSRRRKPTAFWQEPPFRSTDLAQLYEYALSCVGREDGMGMMRSGWAIYRKAGLHAHQAEDFLRDGYQSWSQSLNFQPRVAIEFLTELFEQLREKNPAVPPNIYAVPRELIEPIASHYGMRCWAGNELLAVADHASRPDLRERYEPVVFAAIVRSPPEFVPARSKGWARAYAHDHGEPEPWPGLGG
ncbi:hypothetical protein [Micromonospora sp. 4G55]|uniref:hypothetical protein n=1 Tax=Micromonospora sp. 4G55 TaxID=2806102 RepID=UPI001A471E83|nr:hypothetical protein [Micromonospora sp. 4G55]MBM0256001.1 hypothetical protein [Micromonospora sp. 4G55]